MPAGKKQPSIDSNPDWDKVVPASEPIFQTSVYNYPSLKVIDDYYEGAIPGGHIYSRNGLPNAEKLAKQVAKLEHAEGGIVCSSGMAALFIAICSLLKSGEHIYASKDLYGGTTTLLRDELPRFGIQTNFIETSDISALDRSTRGTAEKEKEKTKAFLVETISNPIMSVCDIRAVVETAHEMDAHVIVDNTFASPFVLRPSELGVDVVMHSGTKSLGGHSDLTIGALCGKHTLVGRMNDFNKHIGAIAGPFDCWLASRSLLTWQLRETKGCENAMRLARFLEEREDDIAGVHYPGLASHPQHNLAKELFAPGMYGCMLSFELKGGLSKAEKFVTALRKATLTPSLGSVKTTISHPGKTSHRFLSPEQRELAGVADAMIRVSVGIEPYEEIEADFNKALDAI